MFVSAKMVTLTVLDPTKYLGELESFIFNVSIIGLVSTTWVFLVFLLSRKWRKTPHFFTMCLVISQVLFRGSIHSFWGSLLEFDLEFIVHCYRSFGSGSSGPNTISATSINNK